MNMNEAYRLLSAKTKQTIFIKTTLQRNGDGVKVDKPEIYFSVTSFSNKDPMKVLHQVELPTLEAAVAEVVRAIDEDNAQAPPVEAQPVETKMADATINPMEMFF